MSEIATATPQGHIEVRNFSLSYETIDGSVEAVTNTHIHVKPGNSSRSSGHRVAASRPS